MQQMLDCPTGGPGCVPDTARHQRWPGPGLGYIQKFIMHYEVLLLIAALPSPAPTTTVTGWAARGAARQVAGHMHVDEVGESVRQKPFRSSATCPVMGLTEK